MWWYGFIVGIFAGGAIGFFMSAILAGSYEPRRKHEDDGGLEACERCKLTMCAECPYPRDLSALEATYNACRHALSTKCGELKQSQAKLCRCLGQQQEIAR